LLIFSVQPRRGGQKEISDAPDRDRVYAQWSVRPNWNRD
jgi:hypothetical protein